MGTIPLNERELETYVREKFPLWCDYWHSGCGFMFKDGSFCCLRENTQNLRLEDHIAINPTTSEMVEWGWFSRAEAEQLSPVQTMDEVSRRAGLIRVNMRQDDATHRVLLLHMHDFPTPQQERRIIQGLETCRPYRAVIDIGGGTVGIIAGQVFEPPFWDQMVSFLEEQLKEK